MNCSRLHETGNKSRLDVSQEVHHISEAIVLHFISMIPSLEAFMYLFSASSCRCDSCMTLSASVCYTSV